MRRLILLLSLLFSLLYATDPVIDLRMDECGWDGDDSTYEIENNGSLGDDYNATALEEANITVGKINSGGDIIANDDSEENKSLILKTDYSLPSSYTLNVWVKFPLNTDGHKKFQISSGRGWRRTTKDVYYFNIVDRAGKDNDAIYFVYNITDDVWSLDVSDDNGGDAESFNPQDLDGWHMLTFIVSDNGTDFYLDGDYNMTFDAHPNSGTLGLLFNSDYNANNDNEPNGQSIGADVDEFEIYENNISDEIKSIYDNENSGKNYDGSDREKFLCPVPLQCSKVDNGLFLSTYDISDYSNKWPRSHSDYDELEKDYAVGSKEFGRGIIPDINTSNIRNNNPFDLGTDDYYLSIIEGYIYIPKAGEYSIAVNGDDAVEVIFNDNYYYGWYGGHSKDDTDHNTKFYFKKAGYYKIKFRHQDWEGKDNYYLYWKKPGDSDFSIVPKDYFFHCSVTTPKIDIRMDECEWDGDDSTYEIGNYGSLGDEYNATGLNDANVTVGKINSGGDIIANDDSEENKSLILKTDYSLPSSYTLNVWVKFPLNTDGHKKFQVSSGSGWRSTTKDYYYFNIADRAGSDSDYIYFAYNATDDKWTLVVSDDDGGDGKDFNPQDLDGWHMLTFVVTDNDTKFYLDGDYNMTFDAHPNSGTLGLLFNSDYNANNDNEPNGQSIGADVDEFEIYDGVLNESDIKNVFENENGGINYDGSNRGEVLCPITPKCSQTDSGLWLSTYDISDYSNKWPRSHSDYDELEKDYAVGSKEFGRGIISDINTSDIRNNNPFEEGTDDYYLSIIEGYIYIPKAGEYSIAVNGDDAVEVIFNDNYYYGWYGGHSKDDTDHNTKFYFGSAGYYKIKFRHQDWEGKDNYYLYWKKPGDSDFSIVPKDYFVHCPPPNQLIDIRMDECEWDGDDSTYEIGNYGSLGDEYNATGLNDANVTEGKIFNGGDIIANNDSEENKSILLKTSYSLPSAYSVNVWVKFPLIMDGHIKFQESSGSGWRKTTKDVYYFNIADRPGSDSDYIFFKYNITDKAWTLDIADDNGIKEKDFNPQDLDGWHMLTFVITDNDTKFYLDGDYNMTFNAHPNNGTLGLLFNSDYNSDSDNEPNGQSIGAAVDEFEIYDGALNDNDIKSIYSNENTLKGKEKNYDGSLRTPYICPVIPDCRVKKGGIVLSTYDISSSSDHYADNHFEFNSFEENFAKKDYRFGQGIIPNISVSDVRNNNPFHDGTDDEYLSIFEGYIYIPKAGEYSIAVNGDDAVEVVFNDDYYFGWYGGHPADDTDHNTKFYFGKPGYYKLKFRHQDWTGKDSYYLYWKKPGDSDYSIVPPEYLWYCPLNKNFIFNAVDYIPSSCNAIDFWDRNITTKIVNKEFNLTILSKDKSEDNSSEANITKIDFYEFNNSNCSGNYVIQNICDDNGSVECNDTSSNGCAAIANIKIDKAVKCIIVHIEGKEADSNTTDINESNATDTFALRPYEFKIINIPSKIKAGDDFNITLEALDFKGNPAKDYNENVYINSDSVDLEYNISNSKCYDGNFTIKSGGKFVNGEANVTLNYDEVGEVNLTLKEVNGTEFAKADADDTNDTDRFIQEFKTQIYVIPYYFDIEVNLSNFDENYTYLDKDLNNYATLDLNISAKNKQGVITKNYNSECYAKRIEINFSTSLVPFPDKLNNLIYYYKDVKGNKSDVIFEDINKSVSIDYNETNFTTDDNGSTHITFYINFDRNISKKVKPFEMNISEINVSDNDTLTMKKNIGKALFYYGNLILFDERSSKDEFDTRDHYFVIYDDNESDDKLPSNDEIISNWYLNGYHQTLNINNDNIFVSKDYNASDSNKILDVNASVNEVNNGKITFHIKRDNKDRKFAVIHLLEPNLKWLWYSKYDNEYNISKGSTCLTHFCFSISWESDNGNSSESETVKTGNLKGTEVNVTESNITKRGVKIFR